MGAQNRNIETFVAATDLSAKKGYAVYLNGSLSGQTPVAAICTANLRAVGIIDNEPYYTDYPMGVVTHGHAFAYAGGAVDEGDPLKTDGNGALVKADTDKDKVVALARQASAAGSELIKVFVNAYELSTT
jgi:hypothetical protein